MQQEQRAFIENLTRQHAKSLAQLAYRLTGCKETSEDLVQEIFLCACLKIDTVYTHPKPLAWLFDALHKQALRERAKAYHKGVSLKDASALASSEIDLPMETYFPTGLTEEEQELLLLRNEMGYSYDEIAEYLGIQKAACRQRYSRIRQKCQALLMK